MHTGSPEGLHPPHHLPLHLLCLTFLVEWRDTQPSSGSGTSSPDGGWQVSNPPETFGGESENQVQFTRLHALLSHPRNPNCCARSPLVLSWRMAKTRAARSKVAHSQKWSARDLIPGVLTVVLCIVFGGLGVYHTVGGTIEITRGLGTLSWKEGSAHVLEVKMVPEKVRHNRGYDMVDTVHVRYQFEALGRSHEGNTIHFEYDARKPVEMHQSLYTTLRATNLVRVFYNERHPEQNVLSRGVDPLSIQKVCIGVVLILFIGLIVFLSVGPATHRWGYASGILRLRRGERLQGSLPASEPPNYNLDSPP
ncbi:MAG: DUF3592 domain-containing protein [Roseimicrobium sp.]